MGLLSDRARQRRFLAFFSRHRVRLSLLLACGALASLLTLPLPQLRKTYFVAENALMPSQAALTFSSLHAQRANALWTRCRNESSVADWVEAEFTALRLESHRQPYHVQDSFQGDVQGLNVFATVPSQRGDGTESLVLHTILQRSHCFSLAVCLSLAALIQSQHYWAKDVYFVFTEDGLFGLHAWLSAAYRPSAYTEQFEASPNSVQAAISLDLQAPPGNMLQISAVGSNGRMPNMDLVMAVLHASRAAGLPARTEFEAPLLHYNFFAQAGQSLFNAIMFSSTGQPAGPHGVLMRFHIEALTLRAGPSAQAAAAESADSRAAGARLVGSVLEGTLRSCNNLSQRFNLSYFYYLLLGSAGYISISQYSPVTLCAAAAAFVLGAGRWQRLMSASGAGRAHLLQGAAVAVACAHGLGVLLLLRGGACLGALLTSETARWGGSLVALPTAPAMVELAGLSLCVAGLLWGLVRCRRWDGPLQEAVLCWASLELSLGLCALTLLNYALAVVLAAWALPLAFCSCAGRSSEGSSPTTTSPTRFTARRWMLRGLRLVVQLACNPLTLVLMRGPGAVVEAWREATVTHSLFVPAVLCFYLPVYLLHVLF
eukprot:m.201138 g.201138  ORF g.201138 m.201138 type:complete len:600 (+) comp21931_c0_seq2:1524-3323(+)